MQGRASGDLACPQRPDQSHAAHHPPGTPSALPRLARLSSQETKMPRKIIIDCDPGHDDAMAILLAHGNPEIELCAITTVAGNQTLEKTTLNARRVCSVANITGVPVAAGCDRPLLRPLVTAPETHRESGLAGPPLADPANPPADVPAVDLIIDPVMGSPGASPLGPIPPPTNIRTAPR